MKRVNETDRAWVAGYLDGDGSLFLHREMNGGISPHIMACDTDKAPIEHLCRLYGGRVYIDRKKRMNGRRQTYVWRCPMARVVDLLVHIRPHLHKKGEQADCLFRFRREWETGKLTKHMAEDLFEYCKSLNARGLRRGWDDRRMEAVP